MNVDQSTKPGEFQVNSKFSHQSFSGGWATPLKNMSSSIGMMTFPIYGKIKLMATKPPTRFLQCSSHPHHMAFPRLFFSADPSGHHAIIISPASPEFSIHLGVPPFSSTQNHHQTPRQILAAQDISHHAALPKFSPPPGGLDHGFDEVWVQQYLWIVCIYIYWYIYNYIFHINIYIYIYIYVHTYIHICMD